MSRDCIILDFAIGSQKRGGRSRLYDDFTPRRTKEEASLKRTDYARIPRPMVKMFRLYILDHLTGAFSASPNLLQQSLTHS